MPALHRCLAEATTPAKTGRAPVVGLGTTMMRRVSGRYNEVPVGRMVAGVKRSSIAAGVGAREALGLGDLGGGHVFVKFVAVKNCETRWRNVHVAEKDVEDVTSRSVNAANVRFSPFCVRCTSGSRRSWHHRRQPLMTRRRQSRLGSASQIGGSGECGNCHIHGLPYVK